MKKETVLSLADNLGYKLRMNSTHIYLEKDGDIFHQKSFDKAYQFLYNKRRTLLKKSLREN